MFCRDEITYNSVPQAHTVLYPSLSWVPLETLSETIYLICYDSDLTIAWQRATHTQRSDIWFMPKRLSTDSAQIRSGKINMDITGVEERGRSGVPETAEPSAWWRRAAGHPHQRGNEGLAHRIEWMNRWMDKQLVMLNTFHLFFASPCLTYIHPLFCFKLQFKTEQKEIF